MEKKVEISLFKRCEDDSYYQFNLIGFNEVYVHDNDVKEAFFVELTFGSMRCKTKLEKISSFEKFKSFSYLMYETMISEGDGFAGGELDVSLAFEVDIKTIALGRNESLN